VAHWSFVRPAWLAGYLGAPPAPVEWQAKQFSYPFNACFDIGPGVGVRPDDEPPQLETIAEIKNTATIIRLPIRYVRFFIKRLLFLSYEMPVI